RCDGTLYEMVPPPRHLAMAIASRIKVMSNLDIAERRLPQDGRIDLDVGGDPVDMRVSVLPTMFGESVVIRVLDRTTVSLDLNKIGMDPNTLAQFRQLIHRPNGICLVTGPTGAGKTTTLYSALNELNEITDKIITTDAPTAVTRLRDMGVEPFLITATLEGILAQRLVRKICEDCRTEFEPSPEMLMELNLRPADVAGRKFFYGRGCDRCNNTGHKG